MSKINAFKQAIAKSSYMVQYKCTTKHCENVWWGNRINNFCRMCGSVNVRPLPLADMIGVGWFRCKCKRIYAGFSLGNVKSKCHACKRDNLPLFIVPGSNVANKTKKNKSHNHSCNVCNGIIPCPVILKIKCPSDPEVDFYKKNLVPLRK